MKGKPNLKVFEDEVKDALQFTGDVALALDTLLAALKPGDRLVLEHGGHVSLSYTYGVLREVGRKAVLEALNVQD